MKITDSDTNSDNANLDDMAASLPFTFEETLRKYSREDFSDDVEEAERTRRQVREQFPLDEWEELPLQRYALGQEEVDDSYCWWLEWNSGSLGSISGGSARKHLIYKQKSGDWYYPDKYDDVGEAWAAVRSGFLEAFELAAQGRWVEADDIEALQGAAALLSKTLTVYFPGEKLPVHSKTHLRTFLDRLGFGDEYSRADGTLRLNQLLHRKLRQIPRLSDWRPKELERLLYTWGNPNTANRVVKISPGENARYWDDCLENGYIRVGWEEVGDLREFESKSDFEEAFHRACHDKHNGATSTLSKKANEVWTLRKLDSGDIIVANRGKSQVLAVGTVKDPGYLWLDDVDTYNHAVTVDWDTDYEQQIPRQERWGMVTVTEVSNELYETILRNKAEGDSGVHIPGKPIYETIATALKRKGQAVLFGPPGTGKTYTARQFAVWWLTRGVDSQRRISMDGAASIEEIEQRLTGGDPADDTTPGPLTFMTFHPSYSYEDFVEGFRPAPSQGDRLELMLEDGAFKRLCNRARNHPDQRYLLIIDEINRANLSKVFGELVTVLERDKRGMTVTLPQSKQPFDVPPNVFILGTMNTVDRSLRHIDAALRRRFRFIEMMPDLEQLRGATVGDLPVDDFLDALNRRVMQREGRHKQIGHSYLMVDGAAVSQPEDFAELFRHEIIPLLQEYCYDDFGALCDYLGEGIVNRDMETFRDDVLEDPNRLVEALTNHLIEPPAE